MIPALVEKCFIAARAGTKAKANDIILMYAEVDVADPVVVSIIQARLSYLLPNEIN